ncbi:MAG: HugZ family protein [Cellvibrionaceae bacterium]
MIDEIALKQHKASLNSLFEDRSVLMLATLNDQKPEASATPFLYYENSFWVYVSRLSSHTQNLLTNRIVSFIISVDESQSANPFALTRVMVQCTPCEENQTKKEKVLQEMQDKLGETVALLQQLPDFHLIRLTPVSGRFIAGFGQAFDIDFSDLSLHHVS